VHYLFVSTPLYGETGAIRGSAACSIAGDWFRKHGGVRRSAWTVESGQPRGGGGPSTQVMGGATRTLYQTTGMVWARHYGWYVVSGSCQGPPVRILFNSGSGRALRLGGGYRGRGGLPLRKPLAGRPGPGVPWPGPAKSREQPRTAGHRKDGTPLCVSRVIPVEASSRAVPLCPLWSLCPPVAKLFR